MSTTDSSPSVSRSQVLIVEDNPTQRATLAALVRSEGFRVDVAGDLEEARQRLEETSPSLVICDHMLPDGRGGDLVECLEGQGEIEALLVTASVDAPELEGRRFLPKPIDVRELVRVLDRHR